MLKTIVTYVLDNFEAMLCKVLLIFFVTILFLQIIFRCFQWPLTWTEEVSRFAFLWFILFGASYATRKAALNRVTLQFSKFPAKFKNACLLLADAIWLIFALIMAYQGYLQVLDLAEFPYFTPALDWSLSWVYIAFPISFSLMAIRIVQVNVLHYAFGQNIADPDQEAIQDSKNALSEEGE
ncbi:TRAP transporter small permease [Oleidesulfovibrio sp.]|uniref:TRAP transporter small permease n=1 Tax=Oleidesulfovibrio sp. TaxID=2909707 RepID=UPI003A84F6D6